MFGLGWGEIALIVVLVAAVFGASRLPKLGADLGGGIRNFGRALTRGEAERKEEKEGKEEGDG